jgi:UDP-GlcNAc:undecaprenyl-phosphate GlcNAc-1-phosphate transferase
MLFSSSKLLAVAASFVLALGLTPLVKLLARHFGVVAKPKTDRWHKKPTAMLGGLAIWSAVAICYFFFVPRTTYGWVIFRASTFLFLVGLIDDLIQIKPYQKLIGQVLGAACSYGLTPDYLTTGQRGSFRFLVDGINASICSTIWMDWPPALP